MNIPTFSAVWVHLNPETLHLISDLCKPLPLGPELTFHHALGLSPVLARWLAKGPSKLPNFATHQVGVAGVVLSPDSRFVLMVRERPGSSFSGWKFPTGLSLPGESLHTAVIRELKEETGLATQFVGLIGLRQQHDHPEAFGCSDLMAVCRLAISMSAGDCLPKPTPCQEELSECSWVPVSRLLCAKVHSVIDQLSAELLRSPTDELHITTLTHEVIRLITDSNLCEWPHRHHESIRKGRWYDLYVPTIKNCDN